MTYITCMSYITNNTSKDQLQKKFKMIAVDESNYEALRNLGRTPESFNHVITKLLRRVKNKE
jgi:predicted CopG family antitoxin